MSKRLLFAVAITLLVTFFVASPAATAYGSVGYSGPADVDGFGGFSITGYAVSCGGPCLDSSSECRAYCESAGKRSSCVSGTTCGGCCCTCYTPTTTTTTTAPTTTTTCTCGSWTNKGCGGNDCAETKMYQTRTCTPSGCNVQSQCVSSASCQFTTTTTTTTLPTCPYACNTPTECSSSGGTCKSGYSCVYGCCCQSSAATTTTSTATTTIAPTTTTTTLPGTTTTTIPSCGSGRCSVCDSYCLCGSSSNNCGKTLVQYCCPATSVVYSSSSTCNAGCPQPTTTTTTTTQPTTTTTTTTQLTTTTTTLPITTTTTALPCSSVRCGNTGSGCKCGSENCGANKYCCPANGVCYTTLNQCNTGCPAAPAPTTTTTKIPTTTKISTTTTTSPTTTTIIGSCPGSCVSSPAECSSVGGKCAATNYDCKEPCCCIYPVPEDDLCKNAITFSGDSVEGSSSACYKIFVPTAVGVKDTLTITSTECCKTELFVNWTGDYPLKGPDCHRSVGKGASAVCESPSPVSTSAGYYYATVVVGSGSYKLGLDREVVTADSCTEANGFCSGVSECIEKCTSEGKSYKCSDLWECEICCCRCYKPGPADDPTPPTVISTDFSPPSPYASEAVTVKAKATDDKSDISICEVAVPKVGEINATVGMQYEDYFIYSDLGSDDSWARIIVRDKYGNVLDTLTINKMASKTYASSIEITVLDVDAVDDITGTIRKTAIAVTKKEGGYYDAMTPSDGAYDSTTESVEKDIGPFAYAGYYSIYVRCFNAVGHWNQPVDYARLKVEEPPASPSVSSFACTSSGKLTAQCDVTLENLNADNSYMVLVLGSDYDENDPAKGTNVVSGYTRMSGNEKSASVAVSAGLAGTYRAGAWLLTTVDETSAPSLISPSITFWKKDPVTVTFS